MLLPNFLVIGAQRSGTTWLDHQLRKHPEVYLPTARKEIHFFDQFYDRGPTWYSEFFKASNQRAFKAIGEITPKYLFDADVPSRIKRLLPDCKFIIILRNPADRAYSQYCRLVKNLNEKREFESFLHERKDVFSRGIYVEQIQRYFDIFPRSNFYISFYETLVQNGSMEELNHIFRFLNVDSIELETTSERVGASYQARFPAALALAKKLAANLRSKDLEAPIRLAKTLGIPTLFGNRGPIPPLSLQSRAKLIDDYAQSVEALESLLNISLELWRT